jgi:actin-related protein
VAGTILYTSNTLHKPRLHITVIATFADFFSIAAAQEARHAQGVHHAVVACLRECDADLVPQLLSNVVFSGGTTLIPGLGSRIRDEACALAPEFEQHWEQPQPVEDKGGKGSVDRGSLVWSGAAVLAERSYFEDMWISSEEYHEKGSEVVLEKCF